MRITLILTSYLTRIQIYINLKTYKLHIHYASQEILWQISKAFIFIRAQQVTYQFPYVTAKSGHDFVTRKTSSKMSPSVWKSIARDVRQAQRATLVRHFTAERLNLLNFEW